MQTNRLKIVFFFGFPSDIKVAKKLKTFCRRNEKFNRKCSLFTGTVLTIDNDFIKMMPFKMRNYLFYLFSLSKINYNY